MVCSNCGSSLVDNGATFCSNCGARLCDGAFTMSLEASAARTVELLEIKRQLDFAYGVFLFPPLLLGIFGIVKLCRHESHGAWMLIVAMLFIGISASMRLKRKWALYVGVMWLLLLFGGFGYGAYKFWNEGREILSVVCGVCALLNFCAAGVIQQTSFPTTKKGR